MIALRPASAGSNSDWRITFFAASTSRMLFLEAALINGFQGIAVRFTGGGRCRLEHRVTDVAAGDLEPLRQIPKIHIFGERRECRMHLHARYLLAFVHAGISSRTCVLIRRSKAGLKFAARFVAKMTTPLNVSSSLSRTLTTVFASRRKPGSTEEERRVAIASASSNSIRHVLPREPEHRRHVLRRLAHPERFHFRVAHDEQAAAKRVGQGLGADRLPGARRPGEVEGECQTGRVPLTETPAIENQVMARHVDQRLVQCAPRRRWQNDIVERAPGDDGVNRSP